MSYSHQSVSDLLADPVCFEGVWTKMPIQRCIIPDCRFCKGVSGFYFVPCLFCKMGTSQCNVMNVQGICRVREDHNSGYPAAYVCVYCFPTLNRMLTEIRLQNMPAIFNTRPLSEVMLKWMLDNWNFFQEE